MTECNPDIDILDDEHKYYMTTIIVYFNRY